MFIPAVEKNAVRITLPCIPVSISGRLSLLSPHAKSQEDGQNLSLYLLQLFKKSLTEILIEHLPKPDIECFSTFYQKNNYCWIFSYFFCHHVLRIDNNFKSLSSCINSCWSLSITRPNLVACLFKHSNKEMMWFNCLTCVLNPARISFTHVSASAHNNCKMPPCPPRNTTSNPETQPHVFPPVPMTESLRSWHTVTDWKRTEIQNIWHIGFTVISQHLLITLLSKQHDFFFRFSDMKYPDPKNSATQTAWHHMIIEYP